MFQGKKVIKDMTKKKKKEKNNTLLYRLSCFKCIASCDKIFHNKLEPIDQQRLIWILCFLTKMPLINPALYQHHPEKLING